MNELSLRKWSDVVQYIEFDEYMNSTGDWVNSDSEYDTRFVVKLHYYINDSFDYFVFEGEGGSHTLLRNRR